MLDSLRFLIKQKKYLVRLHARERMLERNILFQEIRESLKNGEIIEEYLDDRPFPSFLVFGLTMKHRPLHSIWALDKERLAYLISAYEPDPDQWQDYKERTQ